MYLGPPSPSTALRTGGPLRPVGPGRTLLQRYIDRQVEPLTIKKQGPLAGFNNALIHPLHQLPQDNYRSRYPGNCTYPGGRTKQIKKPSYRMFLVALIQNTFLYLNQTSRVLDLLFFSFFCRNNCFFLYMNYAKMAQILKKASTSFRHRKICGLLYLWVQNT